MEQKHYTTPRQRRRAICSDCGRKTTIELHHEPPRCEGGTETIPLCRRCHMARHVRCNDFARWGQRGGQKTAANPANWKRNLKQFRASEKFDVLSESLRLVTTYDATSIVQ